MLHHHRVRRALRGAAALTCTAVLAACTGGGEPEPEPGAPDQVTYVSAFGLLGRDAWVYCGVEQGIFADHGIQPTIEAGSGSQANMEILLGGQADFVISDTAAGLVALGAGTDGWKAVAAFTQSDQSVWMTLDPELQTAQDLEGRTIVMPPGGTVQQIWPIYASLAGADVDKIRVEHDSGTAVYGHISRADAIGAFAVGIGLANKNSQGREVYVHPFSDELTDMYGAGLIATDELIATNPDLVQRFRAAWIETLRWTLLHKDECAKVMPEHEETIVPEQAGGELRVLEPYIRLGGNAVIGGFDDQRIARMISVLEAAGAIPPGITPQDIVAFDLIQAAEANR